MSSSSSPPSSSSKPAQLPCPLLESPSPLPSSTRTTSPYSHLNLLTDFFSPHSSFSPRADPPSSISPALTIRPTLPRRHSSSTTIGPVSHPIPISPPLSLFPSPDYLSQRQSNLEWALRRNDFELERTERAAIERYKQNLFELGGGGGLGISFFENEAARGGGGSEAGTGSIESFEIPIKDTRMMGSASASGVGGLRYRNGRRMSCLASYEGFPVPPSTTTTSFGGGELSSSYEVALDGGGGYSFAPIAGGQGGSTSFMTSTPEISRSSSSSSKPPRRRRSSSPYPSDSIGLNPLSPVSDPSEPCPDPVVRPRIPSSLSDPTDLILRRPISSPCPSVYNNEGLPFGGLARSSSSATCSPIAAPTRVIHGFHLSSSPTSTPASISHSRSNSSPHHLILDTGGATTPSPPLPPSLHSISRGRAGSVSLGGCGGLGGGNAEQERMEVRASRDIEVLDRGPSSSSGSRKRSSGQGGGGSGSGRGDGKRGGTASGGKGRIGREKDGRAAAAERLRKGYAARQDAGMERERRRSSSSRGRKT